jgi:hypothetical protein
MIRRSLFAVAVSLMTVSAFSTTVAFLDDGSAAAPY